MRLFGWLSLILAAPLLAGEPASGATDYSLADAVERVVPGVVNIKTKDLNPQDQTQTRQLDEYFRFFLAPSGPGLELPRSQGSGFFYNSREFIVTNYHVIRDAQEISVTLSQSSLSIPARLVGYDAHTDLAVLQVRPQASAANLQFGLSQKLRLGEPVFAIGNPFGFGHSVSAGIISAKNRSIGAGPYNDFLQTDAALNPGNSGGPLFNAKGEVVGINTAIAKQAAGISFAIPSEIARPVVEALIKNGQYSRSHLGLYASTISDGGSADQSFGVFVERVAPNSPSERAKVLPGDIILAIDGIRTQDVAALRQLLAKKDPGTRVNLKVFRKGERVPITVPLLLEPAAAGQERANEGF